MEIWIVIPLFPASRIALKVTLVNIYLLKLGIYFFFYL